MKHLSLGEEYAQERIPIQLTQLLNKQQYQQAVEYIEKGLEYSATLKGDYLFSCVTYFLPTNETIQLVKKFINKKDIIISIGSGDGLFECVFEGMVGNLVYGIDYENRYIPKKQFLELKKFQQKKIFPKEFQKATVVFMCWPLGIGDDGLREYLRLLPNVKKIIMVGDDTCNPKITESYQLRGWRLIGSFSIKQELKSVVRVFQKPPIRFCKIL